ncbi:MAG: hypothetical protein INR69_21805 [Mucilaginibacter polytrichastri]|nr:hypothetical protein [Mucilaginibacter polytrichastri]
MELHCKIDDVETDADALIPVKKELELEMKAFLEANCWTHSEHLHFTLAEQEIYDNHRGHDIRGIESAMMFPFKTKTEVQKEVEKKMMRSIPFFDRHKSSTPRPPRLKPGETRTTTIILNPPLPPSFPSLE